MAGLGRREFLPILVRSEALLSRMWKGNSHLVQGLADWASFAQFWDSKVSQSSGFNPTKLLMSSMD